MNLSSHYSAIPANHRSLFPGRWCAAVAAGGAAAALAVSGCSAGGSPGTPNAATGKALKQIKLAAATSQKVTSLTATIAVRSVGAATGNLSGTIAMQLKPTTMIEAKFKVAGQGAKGIAMNEILTGKAIYFKDPAFSQSKLGKPWVKADISELSSKSGMTVSALLQNMEGSNPLDQTRLFTASTDVRMVGSQPVDGIPTTEYAGTYKPQAAYSGLTPRLRTLLGPTLRSIGTHLVHFHVWVDSQHLIRKADDTETVHGQTVTTTFVVTSINQPVHVMLPRARDIAPLPKL